MSLRFEVLHQCSSGSGNSLPNSFSQQFRLGIKAKVFFLKHLVQTSDSVVVHNKIKISVLFIEFAFYQS